MCSLYYRQASGNNVLGVTAAAAVAAAAVAAFAAAAVAMVLAGGMANV